MGCCYSSTSLHDEQSDHEFNVEKIYSINECMGLKLLLLGTGESGKSTIQKQLHLLFGDSRGTFPSSLRGQYHGIVRRDAVKSAQLLLRACYRFGWQWDTYNQHDAAHYLLSVDVMATNFWNDKILASISLLWRSSLLNDSLLWRAFELRSLFQISDAVPYFFDRISVIGSPHYIPSNDDILHARLRTSGIVDSIVHIQQVPVRLLDVGGQRNERRKWMRCFSGCHALLYVVAISEFDQVLYEHNTKNRLIESLEVFAEIVQSGYIQSCPIFLFLNKKDLFLQKIGLIDLNVCWEDYSGGKDARAAMKFIAHKFIDAVPKTLLNHLFIHFTVATDTHNIEQVWKTAYQLISKQHFQI
uniref:Uncharacterized protein n=1 Tax=Spongospora subterranea TaxID=70186 RepID=A0A0H5RK30_9EUKA|eukprot:CRZ09084.1 hypothetical protein [Spongospora subterranea]